MAVQDITPKFVDEFYVRLQKTKPVARKNKKPQSEYLTSGTIHSIHKILRCAFEQAVKWEIIARNPFPHANKPKTNYKKRDIWTADMIRKALDECDDMKLYVAMNLAFAYSMRYGEICGLTWDKVHISDEDITTFFSWVKKESIEKSSVFNAFQRPRDDLNVRPIA